nr:immunoglobulin light chain junction region [Macaca mulatta]
DYYCQMWDSGSDEGIF